MGVINLIDRKEAEQRAKEVLLDRLSNVDGMTDSDLESLLDDVAPSWGQYQICHEGEPIT